MVCVTKPMQCTVRVAIWLAVCESCTCRQTSRAVLENSRRKLPKVCNNVFTRCQECLSVEVGHFLRKIHHAVNYTIILGNIKAFGLFSGITLVVSVLFISLRPFASRF